MEREGQSSTTAGVERGGRFVFRGLEAGDYTLAMMRGPAGWALEPRGGVAAGTTGLGLLLVKAAVISGRQEWELHERLDHQRGGRRGR